MLRTTSILAVLLVGTLGVMPHSAALTRNEPLTSGAVALLSSPDKERLHAKKRVQDVCPSPGPEAGTFTEKMIEDILTASRFQDTRQELGLDGLSVSDVHILSDAADQDACQQLNDYFVDAGVDWQPVYYKAGGFYFVASWFEEPRLGASPVLVFNGGFDVENIKEVFFL